MRMFLVHQDLKLTLLPACPKCPTPLQAAWLGFLHLIGLSVHYIKQRGQTAEEQHATAQFWRQNLSQSQQSCQQNLHERIQKLAIETVFWYQLFTKIIIVFCFLPTFNYFLITLMTFNIHDSGRGVLYVSMVTVGVSY